MRTRSIRFRLTIWYAVVLTASLGLFGALLWLALRQQLMGDLERDLAARASRFEAYFRAESADASNQLRDELEEFCQALPPASYIHLRGASGFTFRYPPSEPSHQAPVRIHHRAFTLNGETFELEAATPLAEVRHVLDLVGLLLLSLIPIVVGVACLGGAWLSGRALKPVQDVTAAALSISIENLSGRVPVPATGDEIGRLAAVLNSMLGRLQGAVKTLSQFAADASHELRTPLAVIRTTAELALRRERSSEAYRTALQEIAGESERMTQLIENLLSLARSDAGAVEMPREPIDVRDVLREVCTHMSPLAEALHIRIRTTFGDRPAILAANQSALYRLFLVLLDNALKYSHPGGEVMVALGAKANTLTVTVEDFGVGIGESDLPHIFQRFYQADKARSAGGYGLGLSLAQAIALTHAAEIEVQSVAGAGSTFRVVFPARDARVDPVNAAARAEALTGS